MEATDHYLSGGLAELGIEADEIEMAVISASHQLFWPAILELLALDAGAADPEANPDLSKAP
jgi:hypothetical protein